MGRPINYEQREKIKKISFNMFLKYGYDNVTTRNIAKECGITRSLLYHYYNQKELLLIDVYLDLVREANIFFLKTLTDEQLENLDVNLFFRLLFRIVDIKPAYKNLYLPIYRDVNLINNMLIITIENYDYFMIRNPFSERKKLAMFAVSGIFSQLISLLSKNKLNMSTDEFVDYALRGYYFYLVKDEKEVESLLKYTKRLISEDYIKEFLSIFEEKMK